jgi:HPt (histidine-containing phosphotransfer) domain-containing protein
VKNRTDIKTNAEQNMINDVVREFMEMSQKDLANLTQAQIKNHQIALQRLAEKIKNGNSSFDLSDKG